MTARSKLPAKIHSLLVAPANVAVHGSPGSGKSWIGDQVLQALEGGEQRAIRIDASTATSGRGVLVEILAALDPLVDVSTSDSIRDVWRSVRAHLSMEGDHVVLLLDQFDRVVKFDDALDFLLLFRELVHRPETLRCTALMISRRSLQSIEVTVSGISTLASVCYTEYLGNLLVEDLAGLGPGTSGLDEAQELECLRWSGGHPALAKYWLTTRPDLFPDPAGDAERSKIFLRVVDHLSDLQLMDAAAQYVLGPIVEDLIFERQELELLGVLGPVTNDLGDSFSLSDHEHFRDTLRYKTWNLNPWGLLGQAEVRLRGIVELVLAQEYGDTWATQVAARSRQIAAAHTEALAKRERDRKQFARQAPWLSYTYPGDLWSIIQAEWALFLGVFDSHDKRHWQQVIMGLSQYRAPLAHGRAEVLGESQRTQCRLFAEQVLSKISQYELALRAPLPIE